MVGGDSHYIAVVLGVLRRLAYILADGGGGGQLGLRVGGVSDYIAVGEVGEDELIAAVHGAHDLLRHLRQAQLRLLVEGNALGRGHPQVVLAGEGLVLAAVEEEGHMGVLLRLGAVELPQPRLADHLSQRFHHLFRRKGDGQILEFLMIHGHDDKAEVLHIVPLKMGERGVHEGVSQLDLPLASPAAEDHLISVLDLAHRGSVLVHQSQGLQIIVGLTGLISGLHGPGQGLAADDAAHSTISFSPQERRDKFRFD